MTSRTSRKSFSCSALAGLFCVSLSVAAFAESDRWARCRDADLDARIASCAEVIAGRKRETKRNQIAAYINRGAAFRIKGDFDRALADLERALYLNPKSTLALIERASVYRAEGEFDHAIADYDAAIAVHPKSAAAFYGRGEAYQAKNNLQRAVADYDKALRLDKNLAAAHGGRARAYRAEGNLDKALADFDAAVQLDPKSASLRVDRGVIYQARGDLDRAIVDFSKALELDPKFADAFLNRANAYRGKQDLEHARQDLEAALKLDLRLASAKEALDEVNRLIAKSAAAPTTPAAPAAKTSSARLIVIVGGLALIAFIFLIWFFWFKGMRGIRTKSELHAAEAAPTISTSGLPEPLRAKLSDADDRIRLNHWMAPQQGIAPRIRIGRRWINTLWGLPIAAAALLCLIALAQSLRELPGVAAFIQQHPGIAQSAPSVDSGFPWWLQLQHFLNMFFMLFIMRAGLQILADHPRLYWGRDCTPSTDWFRFQVPVPKERIWTAKDDSVTLPMWLGIPGLRHTIGLARWWHLSINLLWLVNGVIFYALLFTTDQWRRVVPLTWEVFPAALSTAIQYASLNFPVDHSWTRYNGLQQLSYFITIFVAAPVSIVTGLMQSPAISNTLGWFGQLFNRQAMRSVHFISFAWFVAFILAHGAMVFVTGIRQNTNHMFGGVDDASWKGFPLFVLAMAILAASWLAASPYTIRHARLVQRAGAFMIGWIKGLAEGWDPRSQLTEKDISPYFWLNGTMPNSKEFDDLVADGFASYRLRIGGLVKAPRDFSLVDLKSMPKQEQITTHFCIQGWSGVAKWGGVPMREILDLVKPMPEARYAVFFSLADGADGGRYYDVHKIENMRHALTILAYEMNGAPVSVPHGAPLRLRCENELGFKMVKWITAIEFVHDFVDLGAGQGGYNEDHEFYGYRMPI